MQARGVAHLDLSTCPGGGGGGAARARPAPAQAAAQGAQGAALPRKITVCVSQGAVPVANCVLGNTSVASFTGARGAGGRSDGGRVVRQQQGLWGQT